MYYIHNGGLIPYPTTTPPQYYSLSHNNMIIDHEIMRLQFVAFFKDFNTKIKKLKSYKKIKSFSRVFQEQI